MNQQPLSDAFSNASPLDASLPNASLLDASLQETPALELRRKTRARASQSRIWTREKIVTRILELHTQGVDLSPTSIQRVDSALFSSARSRSHFGSWKLAVEACGMDYDCIKRLQQRWSREIIVEEIRAHYDAGANVLHAEFKTQNRSLYLAACAHRYFGSWRNAVSSAGLDHEALRENRVWTKARIQRTICEMNARGESLAWSEIEKKCPGIYRAARRPENFGSWRNALSAAGVSVVLKRRGRRAASSFADEIAVSPPKSPRLAHQTTQGSDAVFDTPLSPMPGGEHSLTPPSLEQEKAREQKLTR